MTRISLCKFKLTNDFEPDFTALVVKMAGQKAYRPKLDLASKAFTTY
jgi:hypothetical protein